MTARVPVGTRSDHGIRMPIHVPERKHGSRRPIYVNDRPPVVFTPQVIPVSVSPPLIERTVVHHPRTTIVSTSRGPDILAKIITVAAFAFALTVALALLLLL